MSKRRVKLTVQEDDVSWTLVRYLDDNVLNDPLKLHHLEAEADGEDGLSAGLEEGDHCLAPHGKQKYSAKIIRISRNKDVILKEKRIFEAARNDRMDEGETEVEPISTEEETHEVDNLQNREKPSRKNKGKKHGKVLLDSKKITTNNERDEDIKKKKKELAQLERKRREAQDETLQSMSSKLFAFGNDNSASSFNTSSAPTTQPSVNDLTSSSRSITYLLLHCFHIVHLQFPASKHLLALHL